VGHYSDLDILADRLLFRVLVLHHWRRIALRMGAWAHASFVPGGEIAKCHAVVCTFLKSSERIASSIETLSEGHR